MKNQYSCGHCCWIMGEEDTDLLRGGRRTCARCGSRVAKHPKGGPDVQPKPNPEHPPFPDIDPMRLVEYAVKNAVKRGGLHRRWFAISNQLAVGSTTAHQLCWHFGVDPDEMV